MTERWPIVLVSMSWILAADARAPAAAHAQPAGEHSPPAQAAASPGDAAADPVTAKFLEARALWRDGKLAAAVPMFEQLVTDHLDHEVAEFSVSLLLDSLEQLGRYEELARWAERLLEDEAFMAQHEELAEQLTRIATQAARKRAEALERAGDYTGCGQAYVDIYNRHPGNPYADELLYNAGVCFQAGRAFGPAITVLSRLVSLFPRSRVVPRALVRLARLYEAVALYARAAESYEDYARRFAGERDARDMLGRAIALRHALGDGDRARRLARRFGSQYGRKAPGEAAAVMFRAAEALAPGDERAAMRELEGWLRRWGKPGGLALQVLAHVRIGELAWALSCPGSAAARRSGEAAFPGACVAFTRPRVTAARGRARAGAACEEHPAVRVVPRDAALVTAARAHFERAVAMFEAAGPSSRGAGRAAQLLRAQALARNSAAGDAPGVVAALAAAYASARFHLLEPDFEAYLGLAFPAELDFDARPAGKRVRTESTRRFRDWLARRQAAARALMGAGGYRAVVDLAKGGAGPGGFGAWPAAAAARIGHVWRAFALELEGSQLPADVRRLEDASAHEAYCDQMRVQTEPLENQAVAAFEYCAALPAHGGAWTRSCLRGLEQLAPARWPPLRERHGRADHLGVGPHHAGPLPASPDW